MSSQLQAVLEQLRPRSRHAVMDLVAQAGIDVSAWAFKRDPKNPEITVSTVQIAPLQPSVGHPTTPTRDLGAELARTEKLERKGK